MTPKTYKISIFTDGSPFDPIYDVKEALLKTFGMSCYIKIDETLETKEGAMSKFLYLDIVEIIDGFYKGRKGRVVEFRMYPKHYEVKLDIDGKIITIPDEYLKKVKIYELGLDMQ